MNTHNILHFPVNENSPDASMMPLLFSSGEGQPTLDGVLTSKGSMPLRGVALHRSLNSSIKDGVLSRLLALKIKDSNMAETIPNLDTTKQQRPWKIILQ